MQSNLQDPPFVSSSYDLVTPDAVIGLLSPLEGKTIEAHLSIQEIDPRFVGFRIPMDRLFFNLKSTLAQVGVDATTLELELIPSRRAARLRVRFFAIDPVGQLMLEYLQPGMKVGKLFAADERRRVRDPQYLSRMFGRSDRCGRPLLSLGGLEGSGNLILEKIEGRTVAYLALQRGRVTYAPSIRGFLPTLAEALKGELSMRELLRLHQRWEPMLSRRCSHPDEMLLVRTLPLHIRTAFARVVDELLPLGYTHTRANLLQPDTLASGDIYELYGESERELADVPLEFYTLEPYREHVFFQDRDQLKSCLEKAEALFHAFETAPGPIEMRTAVFVVKGEQLLDLKASDWVARTPFFQDFPGISQGERQALMIERYLQEQASYPFLQAIESDLITSQGILLLRYFPSPLTKRMLLSNQVQRLLKGIYFQYPSLHYESFFSAEDRALLHDLAKFGIPTYWVESSSRQILQYMEKPGADSGLFVPLKQLDHFLRSTVFGIYGSNLLEDLFAAQLRELLAGVLAMRSEVHHPLLSANRPLALITGGGPGAMAVGNKVAKELQILSCANIVDFRSKDKQAVVNEQRHNPYIDAKMTYRLDKLVERQAEFNLNFPIFLTGGIGTDFEFTLEEVRRKVGVVEATPVLLFGPDDYWRDKISSRYRCNLTHGTIQGSEWVSNCFYCVETAQEGIAIYRAFFEGKLPIGKNYPPAPEGFVLAKELLPS